MNGQFYDLITIPIESLSLSQIRMDLLSHAHGKTLEIGVGTGLNFQYYPLDAEILAIEPDSQMRKMAVLRAMKDQQHHVHVKSGNAERLYFASDSFDTIVATLVFCSIENPQIAMEEIYRVLRPGGSFLLLEHIKKNTPVIGWLQESLTPLWSHIAGGCHLNRDPSKLIREVGFRADHVKTIWGGLGKIWYLKKVIA